MLREECGVFGVYNHPDAVALAHLGAYGLQHRGQESYGVAAATNEGIQQFRAMGKVLLDQRIGFNGRKAISHVRYSTKGSSTLENAQPFVAQLGQQGKLAMAHNGTIVDVEDLRSRYLRDRAFLSSSTSDSEAFLQLVAMQMLSERGMVPIEEAVEKAVKLVSCAYSALFLTDNRLIAVRDRYGFRPVVLGYLDSGDGTRAWLVASETCAIELVGGTFLREVEPGEMVVISDDGPVSIWPFEPSPQFACVFELLYLAKPNSIVFGRLVSEFRRQCGRLLARRRRLDVQLVMPVMGSGLYATLGYEEMSGVPMKMGLDCDPLVDRTFINPSPDQRVEDVRRKHTANRELIEDNDVAALDDTIVRGTTTGELGQMIWEAGAKTVHFLVAAPPVKDRCFFGVDIADPKELVASGRTEEEIAAKLGVTSVTYLTVDDLYAAANGLGICTGCFTGRYGALEHRDSLLTLLSERAEACGS